MSWVLTVLAYSLPFLGVVLVITLVHEFGHFIVARRCGVRVEAFSIGFGRELIGFTDRHGKLQAMHLEGFVARIFQHEYDHIDGRVFTDLADPASFVMEREFHRMLAAGPR